VNRQLLQRQRPASPARASAPPPRSPARRAATGGSSPTPVRVLRRPLVLTLVAGGSVALGVVGWSLLSSPSDPAPGSAASVLVRPRTTQAPTPTASTSPTTQDSVPVTGRDPFGDEEPSASTGRATPPHVEPSPTPTASPTSVPAASPVATTNGAGSSATATVTVGPTYVGLYAWNGSRASFRVNARTYSVHVGTTFGPGLRFTAIVPGTPQCAKVQHSQDSLTLCPGQFTALP
jgi:hypothetical protein